MSLLFMSIMGKVLVLPSMGIRIPVPSPWFISLTKTVVRTVWAEANGASTVARPARTVEERMMADFFGVSVDEWPATKSEVESSEGDFSVVYVCRRKEWISNIQRSRV